LVRRSRLIVIVAAAPFSNPTSHLSRRHQRTRAAATAPSLCRFRRSLVVTAAVARLSSPAMRLDAPSTRSPTENTQRSTMQTPQGLDATHSDELFPVKREYIGINSGVRRASFGGSRFVSPHVRTARHFEFVIRNFCVRTWFKGLRHASSSSNAFASFRSRVSKPSVNQP
jgi:hypothetical protein